jgi:phage anti-repressor protein
MYYGSHGTADGVWVNVNDIPFDGNHPIVYVTEGTHGFYPEAKVYNRMFGFGNDITSTGGITHIPTPIIFKSTLTEASAPEVNWIAVYKGQMADGRISSFAKKPWFETNKGNNGTQSPTGHDPLIYYTTNILIFILTMMIIYITGFLKLGLFVLTVGSYAYLRGSLNETKDVPLTFLQLAKLSNYTEEELEYTKLFWETTFNQSWLYLSDNYIKEWLTNERKKDVLRNFYNQNLIKNYEENIDYKMVTKDHELVKKYRSLNLTTDKKAPHNKKYFIVTGDCLKNLLMTSKTQKGREIRRYYIKTETLAREMSNYLIKYHQLLVTKETKLRTEAEKKALRIDSYIQHFIKKEKHEYIYIATTDINAQESIFKVGRCKKNLKGRLCVYNTGLVGNSRFYFTYKYLCHDAKKLENRICDILKDESIQGYREIFKMRYNWLEKIVNSICNNYNDEIDILNLYINNKHESIDLTPIIPEPINIDDSKTIIIECKSEPKNEEKKHVEIKNIDNLNNDEIKDILTQALKMYATNELQKDPLWTPQTIEDKIIIEWWKLTNYLMNLTGINNVRKLKKAKWKQHLKNIQNLSYKGLKKIKWCRSIN